MCIVSANQLRMLILQYYTHRYIQKQLINMVFLENKFRVAFKIFKYSGAGLLLSVVAELIIEAKPWGDKIISRDQSAPPKNS